MVWILGTVVSIVFLLIEFSATCKNLFQVEGNILIVSDMIQQLKRTHFAEFFLHSFFDGALLSFGSAFQINANGLNLLWVCYNFLLVILEDHDKEDVFVESQFLGNHVSSLENWSFKFLVVLEFFHNIFVQRGQKFWKHGLFFLLSFKGGFLVLRRIFGALLE